MAPTVTHCVWFPAPQGGRILPWGGPSANMAPTVAHCVGFPAPDGGRILPWGGPSAKQNCAIHLLVTVCPPNTLRG